MLVEGDASPLLVPPVPAPPLLVVPAEPEGVLPASPDAIRLWSREAGP